MSVLVPKECKSFNLICARNEAGETLFGRKTRGYGIGKLVLPGGKLTEWHLSAAPVQNLASFDAARELMEETGLDVSDSQLSYSGNLFVGDPICRAVQLFRYTTDGTVPTGSDEVTDWKYYPEPPYDDTPEDYRLWLPAVQAGQLVMAHLIGNGVPPRINVC